MKRALLPLQIGGRWVAIDAGYAREITGRKPWAPVPDAGAYLPGVTAWRGRGIAVVDLAALSGDGHASSPLGECRRVVVVEVGSCTLALFAEAVKEVLMVDEEALRTPHATRQRFASAEVEIDGLPVAVMDMLAVLKLILPPAPEAP